MEADGKDSLAISYLESRYDDAAKQMLFPMYINDADYVKANSIVNYYCSMADDESQAYCKLNSIILDWYENGISPFNMSVTDSIAINDLAYSGTKSSSQAKALMLLVYDKSIHTKIPNDTGARKIEHPYTQIAGTSQFVMYPNPASQGSVIINTMIEGLQDSYATIRIYDVLGNLLNDNKYAIDKNNSISLPINNLSSGVYQVELVIDKYPIQSQKLVIQK